VVGTATGSDPAAGAAVAGASTIVGTRPCSRSRLPGCGFIPSAAWRPEHLRKHGNPPSSIFSSSNEPGAGVRASSATNVLSQPALTLGLSDQSAIKRLRCAM
jgi:hypothetical protein